MIPVAEQTVTQQTVTQQTVTQQTVTQQTVTCDSTDAAVMTAARTGDERAWTILVLRYEPMIRGIAGRHRLTGTDVADICQAVWTRLLEHADRLREPNAVRGWIATTAANASLDQLRARRRSVSVDPLTGLQRMEPYGASAAQLPHTRAVEDDLLAGERYRAVRAGIAELSPDQQRLLVLLTADPPLPYAEISRRMNLPLGSIGPTRGRLVARLRKSVAVRQLLEESGGAALAA